MGGICVLLDKGLNLFAPVELDLTLDDGKSPMCVKGTVVWVVQRRDFKKGPAFDTGVEFTDLSPQNKARLEAVLDKAAPGKKT